jgi:drug/metabolite transporter (DMT)-like permease
LIWLAFAIIYIVWGTTYLAISVAIETIPPFTMSSLRFLMAGGFLFMLARSRWGGGAALPTRREWLGAAVAGFILFVLNNGMIVWAEGHGVPTGIVALLIGTTPMWMVLLNWGRGGVRPPALTWAGLVLGLIGVGLLVNISEQADGTSLVGAGVGILAAFFWALGSLYARGAALPRSPLMSTATQLLWGGALQGVIALALREPAALDVSAITPLSLLAMLYLTVVSSIIAFSAFTWLMRVSDPARVATYAFVNPVIAFILGWLLLGEPLTLRTVIAAGIIVVAVVLILNSQNRARRAQAALDAETTALADTTEADAARLPRAA